MTETTWCAYRDGIVIPGLATVRIPDAAGQCRILKGDRRTFSGARNRLRSRSSRLFRLIELAFVGAALSPAMIDLQSG